MGSPTRSSSRCKARGFTLVELLVVIAIIGVLVSLLLPAVQSARESGRRMHCVNQLRQLALGCLTYHDTQKVVPISITGLASDMPRGKGELNGKGWIVSILPQIEQQAYFDKIDFRGEFDQNKGMRLPANLELFRNKPAILNCPSDESSRELSKTQFQLESIEVALTNYKGCIGDNRMGGSSSAFPGNMPDCHNTTPCNGSFWRNVFQQPISIGDYADGTTNTFLIGEDVPEQNWHSAWFYSNGDYASCHVPPNFFEDPTLPGFAPTKPSFWPNAISFRSRHPSGLNFAFADGSVHFIRESISQSIYRGLATRERSRQDELVVSGGNL